MKRLAVTSIIIVGLLAAACGDGSSSSTGDTTSTTPGSGGSGGASGGSGGAAGSTSASSSASASTASSSTSASSATSASSSGAGPDNVSVAFSDVGLYIDCAKAGADQLQGTVSMNFTSTSATTEMVTLTSATATLHNGAKAMDVTLALKWSTANSQPAGQIPAGGVNGIIYKEQSGAPSPPMDPCALCPINNNNAAPSIDVSLTWDHAGNTIAATKPMALIGCLNMF